MSVKTAIVSAAIAPLILLLLNCQEGYRPVQENSREKDANIRINNFVRQSTTAAGKTEWVLKAEESYLYQKDQTQSKIVVYGFDFLEYDSHGKQTGKLKADRGEINYEEKQPQLTGNVVSTDDTGRVILAPRMQFNMETKILTSDDAVEIREKNLTTLCRAGVIVDKEHNRQVCRSPSGEHVRAPGSTVQDIFQ